VDSNRSRAEEVANQLGTRAFENHQALFGLVDAVSVVVPTQHHYRVSQDFLERDVDVLIEKPITSTLDEADRLIDCAESRGLIIQVGHLERFNPAVMALDGIVAGPRFVESHRLSIFKPRGLDVSVVLDLMIHDIDIILNFVKSGVKNIHAAGIPVITDEVDIANARLEFENGCVANVTASRVSIKNERKLRMFQRDAYISVDFANHDITVIQKKEGESIPGDVLIPGMDVRQLCFTKGDALDDEIKAFVDSVIRRIAPEVTGRVGRNALEIALSIMDQINTANRRLLR
jgi:predicted dehydrogenase